MPRGICCVHSSTTVAKCRCSSGYMGPRCKSMSTFKVTNESEPSTIELPVSQVIAIGGVAVFIILSVSITIILMKYNKRELERVSGNASRRNTQQVSKSSPGPPSPRLTRKDYLSPRSTYSPRQSPRSSGSSLQQHSYLLSASNSAYFTPRESSLSDNLIKQKL